MKCVTASLLLGVALTATAAQPVYRCGNAYSDAACPAAKVIDADDARTDEQRADARRLAADDQRLGQQMARERVAARAALDRAAKPAKTKPPKRIRATPIKWARL
ncbi:MAG: hypothetical protein ABI702_03165 [Burkholderiales bacterium]